MFKIGWISDCHLDLVTDGVDRNPEIRKVMLHFTEFVIKKKCRYVVFGGDIADSSEPSDEALSIIFECLSKLEACESIKRVFWMDGNHEKKYRGKPSCWHFLPELKTLTKLKWVPDITGVRIQDNYFFVFFPHITKSQIPKDFNTPQDYVNFKSDRLLKTLNAYDQVYAFSHLNVKGVVPGTEMHMLKKSEVYLPDDWHTKDFMDKPLPIVLNGHIHTAQRSGHVHIIGSPIFCSFGEKEDEKYFALVRVPEQHEDKFGVKLIKTPCNKFHEININIENAKDFDADGDIGSAFQYVNKNDHVKLNITGGEDILDINWKDIETHFSRLCAGLKPIKPVVKKHKLKRNENQKLGMNPTAAVREFIVANKPKGAKRIFKKAKDYIEKVVK